ncbi:MAG TPA: methyltransferase domain-containing protein, partial [Thermodesulfobacteriaceae bacterium]|nr:methyltransferase domain-containing protein [Thermodesulfobacteriaceae bacterium]
EILDLGCGTGLGSRLYRPFAEKLVGVDISEKMLEKAAEKGTYDSLVSLDILTDWNLSMGFDLIYSADVFVYIGGLNRIFSSAYACIRPGGIIGFSAELLEGGGQGGYRLKRSGRYAHSLEYVKGVLNSCGFRLLDIVEGVHLRQEAGSPVKGFLVAAQRR